MSQEQKPYRRVLVADDHAPTRDDVRRVLHGDARFEVCAEATDAARAVQGALRERPDICLVDVRMPGGGISSVWEIKGRLPQVKIVIFTVSEDDADLFAALRAGVDGYLLKTMNLARLPDALEGVCAGEAAIPRTLVARVLEHLRRREPRWRRPVSTGSRHSRLTSREWEVLELLAEERTTADIAHQLVISPSAVRVHIASIVRKLDVPDRTAAANLFRHRSGN
jgi:DNA-binding NarL/FixJ family response regulator